MDFNAEEDADIAEAIRLSLLEAANSANNARARQQQLQQQQEQQQERYQPPSSPLQQVAARPARIIEFIDLTDDPEPEVKAEMMEYRESRDNFDMSLDEEAMDEHLQYVKALTAASQEMRSRESELERSLSAAATATGMNGGRSGSHEDEDDMDEDFKKALELSLASSRASSANTPQVSAQYQSQTQQQPVSAPQVAVVERSISSPTAIFGMSRAEMEQERQERIKKRALSDGAAPTREVSENREQKRRTLDHPTSPEYNVNGSSTRTLGSSAPPTASIAKLSKASSAPIPASSASSSTSARASPASSAPIPASSASSSTSARASSASSSTPLSASTSAPLRPQPLRNHPDARSMPSTSRAAFETSSSSTGYHAKYHTATFRNTHITGTVLGKWDVRFEDLVSTNHLSKAILTTMDLDERWLNTYIPHNIPQCRVKTWKTKNDQVRGYQTVGKALYVHPPLGEFGSFHAKLMVLFYPTFVRIVISSANLVPHDWGQLVNTVYVQDFEMLSSDSPELLGEFGSTLIAFLTAMELPDKIIRSVKRIDFRPAKVVLIPSVQGWHRVDARHTYGIARLAKVMQTRTTETQEWDMEYQTSSLGKLTVKFLAEIYRASRGFTPRPRIKVDVDERVPPIKIVFPTHEHVSNSRLGEPGAGTVCLRREFWDSNTFPRIAMHDFELVGRHKGSLMHTKVILAEAAKPKQTLNRLPPPPASNDPRKLAGWFYVGSANCTESAWGTISNKRTGDLQGLCINIRNWELGVVYMIETEDEMKELNRRYRGSGRGADDESDQTFFGPLPVPYRRPLTRYYAEDDPWTDML